MQVVHGALDRGRVQGRWQHVAHTGLHGALEQLYGNVGADQQHHHAGHTQGGRFDLLKGLIVRRRKIKQHHIRPVLLHHGQQPPGVTHMHIDLHSRWCGQCGEQRFALLGAGADQGGFEVHGNSIFKNRVEAEALGRHSDGG